MLQETHLLGTRCHFLGRLGFDRVFHAGFSRGSRGVAILLKKSFPFTLLGSKSDVLGRYVVIWGLVEGVAYNFISVYVPPQMHATTFDELGDVVLGMPPGVKVIGGDCSALLDWERDSSRGLAGRAPAANIRFRAWVGSLGLCDVWRTWNPTATLYTQT